MTQDTNDRGRVAELEADNRRLRRLLDQRDAPGELRHRLHSTVALLRMIIRRSAETQRDLESYAGHIEDRLDALARAQTAADERGVVGLQKLVADELLHYGASEGDRATLAGPDIDLQPRAGQVIALAVHELAVNAVEHGALGTDGRVDVSWSIVESETGPVLTFIWHERGGAGVTPSPRQGFGTEVLTRTLAYELKASATLAYEAEGLRCSIRFPLTERLGRLAAQ
jgi:two-component sensor histidine kinase